MEANALVTREIIHIDEEKCDGCGLCVPACAEGALQIIDGKAKLVSDVYCDGMGACLGHCPQDAIWIEKRSAAEFDEAAVEERLKELGAASEAVATPAATPAPASEPEPAACGCPGSLSHSFAQEETDDDAEDNGAHAAPKSQLRNWPVELKLAPLEAPYFDNADILISADCVPFAHADFHRSLLKGKTLLIGCPKLDDAAHYTAKLTEIFTRNDVRSVSIAFMEVPCCFGLVGLIKEALKACGKDLPASAMRISIKGEELQEYKLEELPF